MLLTVLVTPSTDKHLGMYREHSEVIWSETKVSD